MTQIQETTKWHTYLVGQLGLGIVGKRSIKTDPQNYDGDSLFVHKLSEDQNLTDEQRSQIQKDCEDLVNLLKKFYFEDDYVEVSA